MKWMVFWFCLSLLWILSFAHGVHGQGDPFFKGKTVRIVVEFPLEAPMIHGLAPSLHSHAAK
jgi:hypothetical protein